ncbi:MAG: phosphoenolpyruvate--protein phosphotransferase [Bacteroidetes bacterium]|nr:phosphoenolpyruvate--protein phosphotransferase [Bacteroidota bacterium]
MVKKADNILNGIAAAPGIAIAKAHLYLKEIYEINGDPITDVDEAIESLNAALEKSKKELGKVFSLAYDKLGEKRAAIFEAQIMILDDPVLIDNISKRIKKEKKQPEYIVNDEISKYQELMNSSKEPYMKERSHDIEDIKNRIIRNLKKKKLQSRIKEDVIIVSENITPADTVLFSRVNALGYVTNFGGLTSHAAIVARSLNIPAVVGVHDSTNKIKDGDTLIVDGFHGEIIVNPDAKQLIFYNKKIKKLTEYDTELAKLKDKPAVTLDGREIIIQGNLDLIDELGLTIQNGARGLGLVRTEQLFQEFDGFPDEEEQYKYYKELSEKVYPESITIRAFDIGGDKVLPFDVKEPNPFLGWRGIRFLLDNKKLFVSQIRAILRASVNKNIKFLIPMITSMKEIRTFKSIIEDCKNDLLKNDIAFDNDMKIGIMIEVPSAAVLAGEFAEEVDFLSIGTNDLIQYLLAVDRGNDIVSESYQEFHPAVVRTISHIIIHGKNAGAEVSLCGEMAADILAVPLLVGLGLDSISVSASAIPYAKKIIRGILYSEVKEIAEKCLKMKTENEISLLLKSFLETHLKTESQNLF